MSRRHTSSLLAAVYEHCTHPEVDYLLIDDAHLFLLDDLREVISWRASRVSQL